MKRLILLVAFALTSVGGHAANIALFADTAFVDYDPGNTSAEGSNMQAALVAAGHTVTPFTGTSSGAWSTALAGKSILVIPEQENGELAPALPAATITVIANFINGGGRLIVSDDYSSTPLLNAVFGYSIVLDGTELPSSLTPAAASTAFAGGPPTLPVNNATDGGAVTASLPGSSICIYAAGSECMVYLIGQGSGSIVYLAYDWFDAVPVGSQDGGWDAVLRIAAGGGIVPPTARPTDVPTVGGYELAILALVLAAMGALFLRRRMS